MRDKVCFVWGMIFIAGAVFFALTAINFPAKIVTQVYSEEVVHEEIKKKIDSIYSIDFPLTKSVPAQLENFAVGNGAGFYMEAVAFARKFGLSGNSFEETEQGVIFCEGDISVEVYKFWNCIIYENKKTPAPKQEFTEKQAEQTAIQFLKQEALYVPDFIETTKTENNIIVRFYGGFSGIKSECFPTEVTISSGIVTNLKYYENSYERLSTIRVKTMTDAYYELPQEKYTTAQIKNCELAYVYEDSIVQPAYIFSGIADGEFFREVIRAAKY